MASVFLSYDREDLAVARSLARALEKAGHSVWWDRRIAGGAQYSKAIEQALERAEAVVVLWSRRSIDSAWVRDEAAAGRDRNMLVPVMLDDAAPPMGFRQYQAIDLAGWKGGRRGPRLAELESAIEALGEPGDPKSLPLQKPARGNWNLPVVLALIALVAAVAAYFIWQPLSRQAATPVVVVRGADASAGAAQLARSLLARLGDVQPTRSNAPQLLAPGAAGVPDYILEVSEAQSAGRPSATLVLLSGKDHQLLSSHSFSAPGGRDDDIPQSLAMFAARLLDCAADTFRPRGGALRQADVKLYIGACGRFGMMLGYPDVEILVPPFEQVVRRSPAFAPAWRQLLLTETSLQAIPGDTSKPSPQMLRDHIAAARRIDPGMAEAVIAEIELLPVTAFEQRVGAAQRLAERNPANPYVLGALADQLMRVGRTNDAVVASERAKILDPLSPYARNIHIRTLAYSGRIPNAFQELEAAGPLTLGADNLIEARFRLNMRYGDAPLALALLRARGTSKQHEAFLLARIEPTPANIERALAISRATSARIGYYGSHSEVLAAFGREDELYNLLIELPVKLADTVLVATLFRPTLQEFRKKPRFLAVAKRFGMLDYWRHSDRWPDFCSEPALPYDCKAEAAKLGS